MSDPLDLFFTQREIRGSLPSGWNLATADSDFIWDRRRKRWTVAVRDPADVERSLHLDPKDLERLGRLTALRAAIDRLFREALR